MSFKVFDFLPELQTVFADNIAEGNGDETQLIKRISHYYKVESLLVLIC